MRTIQPNIHALRCLIVPNKVARVSRIPSSYRQQPPLGLNPTHHRQPLRNLDIRAHSSASAAAATKSAAWFSRVTTGVPLLEFFHSLSPQQAAINACLLIASAIGGTVLGLKIINYVSALIQDKLEQEAERRKFPGKHLAFGAALVALRRPAQVLLPFAAIAFVCTVGASFLDVFVERIHAHDQIVNRRKPTPGLTQMIVLLHNVAQVMQDTTEVLLLVLFAWLLINWKDIMVRLVMEWERSNEKSTGNLTRILLPLSTLSTWAIIGITTLTSLGTAGVDVRPLLALGSVSTLAIGLAAQSTMTNVVSAFTLYTSRPFIEGDRISLKTISGALVAAGTVRKILPMQTVLITDSLQQVSINNKDVASMIIVNESKEFLFRDTVPGYPSVEQTITVRYADVDKVPGIEREATELLKSHPLTRSTCRCTLTGYDERGAVLTVKYSLKREAYKESANIHSDLIRKIEHIVRSHGAFLAMEEDVEFPAPLEADALE